ncbi:unnamed protein product [Closterium sp. Yama58-4]|nr:unnamed protein product [Closterium sp. Yama58-4]
MWNRATAGDSSASANGSVNTRNSLRRGVRSLSSPALDSATAPPSTLSRRRRSIDEARVAAASCAATVGGAASRESSTQLPPQPKPYSPTTAYDVARPAVHRASSDSYLARNAVFGAAVFPLELPRVASTSNAAASSPQGSAQRHAARIASPIISPTSSTDSTTPRSDECRRDDSSDDRLLSVFTWATQQRIASRRRLSSSGLDSRLSRRNRRSYDVAARMSDEDAPSADTSTAATTAAAATRAASAGDAANGGDASVEVLGSNSRRVSARVVVPASADVVWGVLTDYERLADFIPSLATNQMLQRRSNGARLLQVGEQDVAMGIKFRAKVVVDVEEGEDERLPRSSSSDGSSGSGGGNSSSSSSSSSGEESDAGIGGVGGSMRRRRIHFKMVEGDFQKFVGVWTLEEQLPSSSSGPTTLSYSVELTPHFWLPVALVEGRISKEIKANLAGVRQEAYRRIQVALSQVLPAILPLLLILVIYHFTHGAAASAQNVPVTANYVGGGTGVATNESQPYEDWSGMSLMDLEAAAKAAASAAAEAESASAPNSSAAGGRDSEEGDADGGLRRSLAVSSALSPLASAWHSLLIAQYLSRTTACGATLTRACRALQMADSLVKSGKPGDAVAQTKLAGLLARACAGSVPANAAKQIRLALPQINLGQNALLAGGSKSVRPSSTSGKRSSSSGKRTTSTGRKKGGHKWKDTPATKNRKKGGHKYKDTPATSKRVKGGHKYKRGTRRRGSRRGRRSRSGSRKSGSSSKAPAKKDGDIGWLGHNDVAQGIMQWLPYGNPIDDCWMGPNWQATPTKLASCVEGYATGTTGGANGRIYHVTSNQDDRINPKPGTLRYGATRKEPLWIVFDGDFDFTGLEAEIIVYNDKTVDARGRKVTMGNGPCMAIEFSHNVIVHGMAFKNCKNRVGGISLTTGPDNTVSGRNYLNGYGLYIYASHHVWVDHCSFDYADDTHIDIVAASTAITVSNCYFTNQDKVILMGHDDTYSADRNMRVTVMLNKFGPNLSERLPRGRFGQFHVLNNYYPNGWGIYAIGGSADPTFLSEGNYFVANDKPFLKEVTKHNIAAGQSTYMSWDWQSVGDHFENGAFFTKSGSSGYKPSYSYKALSALEGYDWHGVRLVGCCWSLVFVMGATRKLQGEIDRVLKKVQEGVEIFDGIWNKVYDTENLNQKEKFEADLKKEIKKLQRYRDQIKTWIQSSEIKDKKALLDARKLIEREMERFKVCEKETKTKAFSKEGLGQQPKTDPREKAKSESRDWLNQMVSELESQIDSFESEMEGLQVKRGKQRPPRLMHLEESITRHKAHITRLEMILRLMDNDELSPEQVTDVKDLVEDYVERNQDDFDEFGEPDDLYESLPLEKMDALESLESVPIVPQAIVVKEKAAVAAASGLALPKSILTASSLPKSGPAGTLAHPSPPSVSSDTSDSICRSWAIQWDGRNSVFRLGRRSITSPPPPFAVSGAAAPAAAGPPGSAVPSYSHAAAGGVQQQAGEAAAAAAAAAGAGLLPGVGVAAGQSIPGSINGAVVGVNGTNGVATRPPLLSVGSSPVPPSTLASGPTQSSAVMSTGLAPGGLVRPFAAAAGGAPGASSGAADATASATANPGASILSSGLPGAAGSAAGLGVGSVGGLAPPGSAGAGMMMPGVGGVGGVGQGGVGAGLGAAAANVLSAQQRMFNAVGAQWRPGLPSSAAFQQLQGGVAAADGTGGLSSLPAGVRFPPGPKDSERPRAYIPRNPAITPASYPQAPAAVLEHPGLWERLDMDVLFFAFYHQQGTFQQYLAARELKKQSWRYHKKYNTWFQRHEEPKLTTDDYEQGTYVYFDFHIVHDDYQTGWCQRIKTEFTFEYSYLEDELPAA